MKLKLTWILTLFMAFVVQLSFGQEKDITGTVTEASGLGLPGATVIVKGTTRGQQTDFDGKYSIKAKTGDVLVFSFVSMKTIERTVGENSVINVTMEDDVASLDEVVVVGYGSKSRDELASAISVVKSSEIESFVGTTSIDNILQGKAAGVTITATNGRPGNPAFVRIRGSGTFNANSSPLYVVDGVPIDATDLGQINPSDVESISVLKDAATASRYGSRASNGVILVTTKKGKSGEAKISLTQTVGFTKRIEDNFDLFSAQGKLDYERELADLGVAPALSQPGAVGTPEELRFLLDNAIDIEDDLLQSGIVKNTNISISGGSDKLTYFFSAGYGEDTGIVERADPFRRITARLNTTYQAKDWLNIGVNASFSRSEEQRLREGRANVQNPFVAIYQYNPYETIFVQDADGNDAVDANGDRIFSQDFPLAFNIAEAIINNPDVRTNLTTIASSYADIRFSDKFSNKFQVGISNNRNNRLSNFRLGSRLDAFIGGEPGGATRNGSNDFEYNVSNIFSYDQQIGKHNINAGFLLEYNENNLEVFTFAAQGFPTNQIDLLNIASTPTAASTTQFKNTLFSQALLLDYSYDDRYVVSGSVRRDGSSRFGPSNQYGTFYSGALGWNIHNEEFFKSEFINNLKFRTSYGTSGNQNIGDNLFLELLQFGATNGNSNLTPVGVGNPQIKWEAQELFNVGFEYAFWNNRVRGVVDYFNRTSNDLLAGFPLSTTVGDENDSVTSNIGEIENSGIELELSVDVVRNKDFTLTVGGNAAFIDNEVNELRGGADVFRGTGNRLALREGEEVNTYNLVRYVGVDTQTGAPQYLDANGDITNTFQASDAVVLSGKSPLANVEGGFFTNIRYKNWELSANATFRAGNYIYNNVQAFLLQDGNGVNQQQSSDANNFWRNPGDTNVLPSPLFRNDANQQSDRFLQKGDFIRLRNLVVAYNLPESVLESLPISKLRLFFQGQNLLTFRPHFDGDPEVGAGATENGGFQTAGDSNQFNYPNVVSYSFGVQIDF